MCRRRASRPEPPRDALLPRRVGEPQQQIAVACRRRAEAQQILAAKLVEIAQKVMLIPQSAKVVYAYYHGHLIETFLNHFDKDFTKAEATSLPTSGDHCSS
jgi:hypothetical protein